MERAFTSLADLRTEIDMLKIRKFQQEEAIKEQLSSPVTVFRTLISHFRSKPSAASDKSLLNNLFNQDIVTYIARFAFPLLLNGTMFKRAGFITKSVVTFLSQKAAKKVNVGAISGIVNTVKGWFAHKKKERTQKAYKKAINRDYGIPPYSESY